MSRVVYVPPPGTDVQLPALIIQCTTLKDSAIISLSATELPDGQAIEASKRSRITLDWACAMPPLPSDNKSLVAPIFRTTSYSIASPIAQRLATRFRKQIFLSIDFSGQESTLQPYAEKKLVGELAVLLQ